MTGLEDRYGGEIFDFLPDATFVIDAAGVVIAWNRAMEEMTGVAAQDILGRGDYEYSLPFYGVRQPMLANLVFFRGEEVEQRYDTVERLGDTLVVDIHIPDYRDRGAYFWAKASPLYGDGGEVVGAIETIRDITDRKLAEQDAEANGRRLSDIIDFLPDATFTIDTDGVVIAWNRAMEAMTGVAARDVLGRGDYEYALPFYGKRQPMLANLIFLPPEELGDRYDHIAHMGDTLVVDIHIPDFQDRGAYFWAKASPLYGPDGSVTGAIETVRDITDRKRAEQEAEQNRRRMADIIAFLPDPTMVIDTEGTVMAWNRAMEELTDVPAAEMVGRGDHEYALPFYGERRPILADLVFLPPEELADRYDHIKRVGETLVVDIYVPAFRGHGGYLWAKAGPLRDADGNVTGAIETVRDITERREMEERLARSNAELEIAAEIQQSFLPDAIPQLSGYDIAGRSVMAKEVGGDFFDALPFEVMAVEDDQLGILIADVAGKGVPAALFMALSRVVVRVNARVNPDPAKIIADANDVIAADATAGMFVTLFYGLLSESRRELTYVNAGHNPPLVVRAAGPVERLPATGIALGAMAGREYTARTIGIGAGDVVVLYTDGVTEAIDGDFHMFTEERLLDIIRANAAAGAAEIVDAIFAAVDEFCADEPQFDDITLMVVKGK